MPAATHHRPRRSGRRRARRRGFTLIELSVVVVIIGVFAALAIPQVTRQLRDRRVQQAAEEIASLYRQARLRAMGGGGAVTVRYAPGPSGAGQFTVTDAIVGATDGNVACAQMPNPSCTLTNWASPGETRPAGAYNAGADPALGLTVQMWRQGAAQAFLDVCFSPRGRTFVRAAEADPFAPLAGAVTATVARNVGLTREIILLPSGITRTATRPVTP